MPRRSNPIDETAQGMSQILGDTAGFVVNAAQKTFPGPSPDKTALVLQPPKPPAGWATKTRKSAFYGEQ